eukprot:418762-Pyramimonas_sp.AAC.1
MEHCAAAPKLASNLQLQSGESPKVHPPIARALNNEKHRPEYPPRLATKWGHHLLVQAIMQEKAKR